MASKKPATAVAKKTTGTALMAKMMDIAKGDRMAIAKAPAGGAQNLSFNNGMLAYMGKEIPGGSVDVIILRSGFERVYYEGMYDPNAKSGPACYSFDGATPHDDAADPQHKTCAGCPMNEWETDQRGKGKACKEGLRLALLLVPKGIDVDRAASLPVVTCKLSVLNSKDLAPIIDQLYEQFTLPCKAIMKLSVRPDNTRQVVNDLEFVEEIEDEAILEALVQRLEEAGTAVSRPYPKADPDAPKRAPARKAGGAKKARRY